jgi:hypothetical protein
MVWFVSRRQGWFVNEGFDDARRDTLFLTMPVSRKGTLVQYAGRLHRLHPSKEDVRIYRYAARHALRSDDLEPGIGSTGGSAQRPITGTLSNRARIWGETGRKPRTTGAALPLYARIAGRAAIKALLGRAVPLRDADVEA